MELKFDTSKTYAIALEGGGEKALMRLASGRLWMKPV